MSRPAPPPEDVTIRLDLFKGVMMSLAKAIASVGAAVRGPLSVWSRDSSLFAGTGDDTDSGALGFLLSGRAC